MTLQQEQLSALISGMSTHPEADFYRDHWGGKTGLENLPAVTREDFLRVPLSRRRYKNETSLVKIVREDARSFLSEWSFADIGKESFGLRSERPMVYMSDPYEAIEKSMWCYENGMVPLVGEKDADVAMFAASKYDIDSLITDAVALPKLRPYLEGRGRLKSISVLGTVFDLRELASYVGFTETLRLVLSLPETGAFAEADYAQEPRFKALPGCMIERGETIVVSKVRLLVTPVIRYRTDIPSSAYDGA
jgi:hypothetical protein